MRRLGRTPYDPEVVYDYSAEEPAPRPVSDTRPHFRPALHGSIMAGSRAARLVACAAHGTMEVPCAAAGAPGPGADIRLGGSGGPASARRPSFAGEVQTRFAVVMQHEDEESGLTLKQNAGRYGITDPSSAVRLKEHDGLDRAAQTVFTLWSWFSGTNASYVEEPGQIVHIADACMNDAALSCAVLTRCREIAGRVRTSHPVAVLSGVRNKNQDTLALIELRHEGLWGVFVQRVAAAVAKLTACTGAVDARVGAPVHGGMEPAADDVVMRAAHPASTCSVGDDVTSAARVIVQLRLREPRKAVPTRKEIVAGRVVRWCADCKKHVNYKNYSHHRRDIHGESPKNQRYAAKKPAPVGVYDRVRQGLHDPCSGV